MITRKKVTTLPTILYNASISYVAVEQVFDRRSPEASRVGGKPLMTAKSILSIQM
jgi:hypothetical protein